MRDYDPVEGVDYIVDHYAILGVPEDISADDLKRTYRELAPQYHTDVLERAAPEIKAAAERKFMLIDKAYKTLQDPEKRGAYDELLANFPKHLISKSGNALVNPRARHLNLDSLVAGTPWEGRSFFEQHAQSLTGFDPDLLELAEQSYKKKPTEKTKSTYKKALMQEFAYLAVFEDIAWADAGVSNPGDIDMIYLPEMHAEQRAEQIAAIPAEIEQTLTTRIDRMLKGTAAPLLLGGTSTVADIDKDELNNRAVASFKQHEEELQRIAEQRSTNLEKLIKLTDFEYVPTEQPKQNQLLIATARKDIVESGMLFSYEGNTLTGLGSVGSFDGMTTALFRSEHNASEIAQSIAEGNSVILLYSNCEIDQLLMELSYVAMRHFDPEKA